MPNIIGIGNSQAPTNAMLGGLAYQDSVGEIKVEKIKARIEDTVKDVFCVLCLHAPPSESLRVSYTNTSVAVSDVLAFIFSISISPTESW